MSTTKPPFDLSGSFQPVRGNQAAGPLITSQRGEMDFEQAIQQFEQAWNSDQSFESMLPVALAVNDPELFCEFACIDMEFRWEAGQLPELETYLAAAESSGIGVSVLSELAFEDYRLRSWHGSPRQREEYAARWQLDVSAWPIWEKAEPESVEHDPSWEVSSLSTVDLLGTRKTRAEVALPQLGTSFHGCKLLGVLGRGAFGAVYLARQTGLANRFVVLKVSPLSEREPQMLASLQHTHIVPIYSTERDEHWQSICMPFLGLVTLAELRPAAEQMSASGQELLSTVAARKADTLAASSGGTEQLPPTVSELLQPDRSNRLQAIRGLDCQRTLLWMFARIADALDFSHSRGVIHGDIKPANILISDDGNPLLLDFHLAARIGELADGRYIGGTLPYMSPGQIRALQQGKPLEPSADLFSLGVVMYELLGGRLPYPSEGKDSAALDKAASQREAPPAPLSQLKRGVSVDVETIVLKCLALPGTGGYRSLRELQEDLDAHLADRPLRHAPNRSLRERTAKWVRRHPVLSSVWSLTSVFLLMALLLGSIVAAQLQRARTLEATAASQRFVDDLQSATLPLTVPGISHTTMRQSGEKLLETVSAYYANSGTNDRQLLNDTQRQEVLGQLSSSIYWWARNSLAAIDSRSDSKARLSELRSIDQRLQQFVAELPPDAAVPFVQLETVVQQSLSSNRGDFSASKLLASVDWTNLKTNTAASGLLNSARHLTQGESLRALEDLGDLLAIEPGNFQAWLLKGHAWLQVGNRERAVEAYSFCIDLQPQSPWGWFQRGVVRLEQRQFEQSIADFNRCIELEPEEPAAWLNRALAYRELGKLENSLDDLSRAIELGCNETRVWYLRHQTNLQLGRSAEAAADMEKFLQLEPSDLKSWLSRGIARVKANQPELALADFQAGARLAPEAVDAWQNIATVQSEMLQQIDAGIAALSRITDLRPADPIPLLTRAALRARTGDRERATADADTALRLRRDPEVLLRAAGVYAMFAEEQSESESTALSLLRAAAYQDPDYVLSRLEANGSLQRLRVHPEYKRILVSLRQLAGYPDLQPESKQ